MSMFNAKSLGGLGRGLGGSRQPLDPAAEIARLLNQHTHHWMVMGAQRAAPSSVGGGAAVGALPAAALRLLGSLLQA